MIISDIESLTKQKNKVFIDDDYAFMLYDRELSDYNLTAGSEISVELYDRIIRETVLKRAYQKVMSILERMDKTTYEIRLKLRSELYTEDITEAVINHFVGLHYLDDVRYAANYIRCHSMGTSARELKLKLMQKGIDSDTVRKAFDTLAEEGEEISDSDAAMRCLSKKLGGRTEITSAEEQKIKAFMYRKGYERSDIEKAFASSGLNLVRDSCDFQINIF